MALKISSTDNGVYFKKGKNIYDTEKYSKMGITEEVKPEEPKKARKIKTEE